MVDVWETGRWIGLKLEKSDRLEKKMSQMIPEIFNSMDPFLLENDALKNLYTSFRSTAFWIRLKNQGVH